MTINEKILNLGNNLFGSHYGITMVDKEHIIFLINYIKTHNCNKMVEVGVAKGGCIAFS